VLAIIIYVDDLLIASSSMEAIDTFKAAISNCFSVKDLGALEFFVGIRVTRDRPARALYLDQSAYLERVLERYNMTDCKPLALPASGDPLSADMSPTTPAAVAAAALYPYSSAVGSLLYAAVCTRPDIANPVRCVAQFMHNHGAGHWVACKRIMRYLKGTLHYKLRLGAAGYAAGEAGSDLVGHCDADHAGDLSTRRSTTGYVFTFGGAAISWCSRLQATVALSSTEAEYMAVTDATCELLHLLQLFKDLQRPQQLPVVVFEDNQSAIHLATNHSLRKRTKHIDVRYHFIRERVAAGVLKLEYQPTKEQLADGLTKNATQAVLDRLVATIFVV
jgi:hypothetical protein